MRLSIHEVLQRVSDTIAFDEKVRILQQNDSPILRDILRYNFDAGIKFNLPEGDPPFKTDRNLPMGMSDTNLFQEGRRLYIFIEGLAPAGLKRTQRETLFINLLEGLHFTDAELIVALKDKLLSTRYPGLADPVVLAAFPGLYVPTFKEAKAFVAPVEPTLVELPVVAANAPTIVPRGEEPKEKKPTNPKKVAACLKAAEARRRNAAARREAKAAALAAQSQD